MVTEWLHQNPFTQCIQFYRNIKKKNITTSQLLQIRKLAIIYPPSSNVIKPIKFTPITQSVYTIYIAVRILCNKQYGPQNEN